MKRGFAMKTLYFDCFSGISGDMVLGALIDCGIDGGAFKNELSKLNVDGYDIEITKGSKKGISGTDVFVKIENEDNPHCHIHRNLEDIDEIIDRSSLNQHVKEVSKKIFLKLAEAEAKVHSKKVEEVHFHEVGALDSIVDIVGCAICIDMLNIERFAASRVNTGMGFVECRHGIMPVPAPAAAELLTGIPIYSMDIETELVTPTGAAILSTLCESFGPIPAMTIGKIGYGLGKKDIDIPNLLRVFIGDQKKNDDSVLMMECNIDDMNSEFYEHTMDKLFEAGALDVFLTNIIMKKSRPAVKLSVLARYEDVKRLSAIIFSETSTIGIRKYSVDREILDRSIYTVHTKYGSIKVKAAYHLGTMVNYAPEYESVKSAAEKVKAPVKEVYNEALREFMKLSEGKII